MCKPVEASIKKCGIFSAASVMGRLLMLLYFNEKWASMELKNAKLYVLSTVHLVNDLCK